VKKVLILIQLKTELVKKNLVLKHNIGFLVTKISKILLLISSTLTLDNQYLFVLMPITGINTKVVFSLIVEVMLIMPYSLLDSQMTIG